MEDLIKVKNLCRNLSIYQCSSSKCIIDDKTSKKNILICKKCKQSVHYVCSQLPAYQIQLCLTFKARSFQCQNCVEVLPEISEKIEKGGKPKTKTLEKEIKACENIIKVREEHLYQSEETSEMNKTLIKIKEDINDKMEKRFAGVEKKIGEILNKGNSHSTAKKSYAQALDSDVQSRNLKKVLQEEKWKRRKSSQQHRTSLSTG